MWRSLCTLLTLTLAVACGPAPYGSITPPPLQAEAITTNPCDLSPCQWNDLVPPAVGSTTVELNVSSLLVAQNLPIMAYSLSSPSFSPNAFVRVRIGATWEVAQRLNDTGSSTGAVLAQSPDGTGPVLAAFAEQRGKGSVLRLKYRTVVNGASVWRPFDARSDSGLGTPGREIRSFALATTPNFTVVAWGEDVPNADPELFVWMYQGGVWRNLGTRANGSFAVGGRPNLAVNASGNMALAYAKIRNNGAVYFPMGVLRWNGRSFVSVPDPFGGESSSCSGSMLGITSTGTLVGAFCYGAPGIIKVQQFAGSGPWTTLGAPLNVVSSYFATTPLVKVSGTVVTVAWFEQIPGSYTTMYAKRWNPASQTWTRFGTSVNAGGSTRNGVLALYANGNPLVALTQSNTTDTGPRTLYVRDWSPGVPPNAP